MLITGRPRDFGCTVKAKRVRTGPNGARHTTGQATTARVAARRTALVVLGMHRSGTSALTRVISLLGADLPSQLMPGMAGVNETGFWESLDIYDLNEEILALLGSRWDDWCQFTPDWMQSPVSDLKARALGILEQDFAGSGLFVLKDPRLCRLLPFWLECLQQFGAETKCILPFRNPIEVAASLRKRDGFNPAKSYMLWLRHVLEVEQATRNLPRAFIAYDDLLGDWRGTVSRIAERLGLSWPGLSVTGEEEIDAFLKTCLRHHITDETSLQQHPEIVGWIKDTFTLLQDFLSDPESQESQQGLDEIRLEFDRASEALGAVLRAGDLALEETRHMLLKRDAEAEEAKVLSGVQGVRIKELEKIAAALECNVQTLETTVGRQHSHIDELAQDIIMMERRMTKLRATLKERDKRITGLEYTITNRDARVSELESRAGRLEEVTIRQDDIIRNLEGSLGRRDRRIGELEQRGTAYRAMSANLEEQRNQLLHRLNAIHTSRLWRFGNRFISLESLRRDYSCATRVLPPRVCFGRILQTNERRQLRRLANELLAAGLFDASWYAESYPDVVLGEEDPVWHWLVTGWHEGLNPNSLFDIRWYQEKNPDVSEAKINPLLHYLDNGAAEGRDPGPLFHTDWYLAHNRDVRAAGINPFVHYLKYGKAEGRNPNPLFDSAWYLRRYPQATRLSVDALEHYLTRGVAEGCDPCPLFDTAWYLAKNADVMRCGVNPLVHYLARGAAQGCDPNPLFDSDWYLKEYPDVAAAGLNPLAHYLVHGAAEGRKPCPAFDTSRYVARYGDVIPSGLNPLHHYLFHGGDERLHVEKPGKAGPPPEDRQAGSRTTDFDPGVAWPTGLMGLLIAAAYHNDTNIASQSWRSWKEKTPDLDAIDWQTARMVSQTAATLSSRRFESTDLATQKGIRQFDWGLFENHLCNARPFLNALAQAKIPVMVSKGAAILLSGVDRGSRRLMADLDILVGAAHIDNVMDAAESTGWKSKWPLPRKQLLDCLQSSRHSVPLSNGEKGEIDLHTSALLLNRCPDHDTSMWARSTEARIGDLTVYVPSAVDLLVVTLGHGLLFTPRPMGIWVSDAIALIESGAVDWDIFLDEIERRDLAAFAYAGLEYISQSLGRSSVPGYVLTGLASRLCEPFLGEFLGHVKSPHATSRTIRQSWGAAAMIRAAKWKSRMSSPRESFRAATRGPATEAGWQDACRQSSTSFMVEIPGGLRNAGAQGLLEIELNRERVDYPQQLSLALTCFDYHKCELNHWDSASGCAVAENGLPDQHVRFSVDAAIIQAYSLRKLELELLAPDTLDASPVGASEVRYRWRT